MTQTTTPPAFSWPDIPFVTPLTRAQLATAGVPEGWNFGMADVVRFHELDALNHVNNVAYFRWFESLRIPYFQAYHLSSYQPGDPTLVVMTNTARYHAPMFLNEAYVTVTRAASFRNSSFRMEYATFSGGSLRATGDCIVVCLEDDATTKRPLPEAAVQAFLSRDGATREST